MPAAPTRSRWASGDPARNDEPVAVAPAGLEALRCPTQVAKPDVPLDGLDLVVGFAATPGKPALDGDPSSNSPYTATLIRRFGAVGCSVGDLMTLVCEEGHGAKARSDEIGRRTAAACRLGAHLADGGGAGHCSSGAGAYRAGARSEVELALDAYAAALDVYGARGDDYASYFGGKLDDIDKRPGVK